MLIHRDVASLVTTGDARAYIATKYGFLKGVKVGAPEKPIHGYFIGPVNRPTSLEDIDPQVILLDYVPVPALIIAKAYAIFRHVYENFEQAEMIVLLRWKEIDLGDGRKIGRYYLDRAERVEVAAGGLDYVQHVPIVGSLHSHGAFGAGFSNVDDRWERDDAPGIYITIGNVNQVTPSIETSVGGLGARKIIEAPTVPPEIFKSVNLSRKELDWWTETLVVKRYSRTNGFYICCGPHITGWVETKARARLTAGEHLVAVSAYKKPAPKTIPTIAAIKKHGPALRPLLQSARSTPTTIGAFEREPLSPQDERRINNFIRFLSKRNLHEQFISLLVQEANDLELDEVLTAIDMLVGLPTQEEREEAWLEHEHGMSLSWDAAGLDIISGKQWDEFFRR